MEKYYKAFFINKDGFLIDRKWYPRKTYAEVEADVLGEPSNEDVVILAVYINASIR